jgi:hypothetical protein
MARRLLDPQNGPLSDQGVIDLARIVRQSEGPHREIAEEVFAAENRSIIDDNDDGHDLARREVDFVYLVAGYRESEMRDEMLRVISMMRRELYRLDADLTVASVERYSAGSASARGEPDLQALVPRFANMLLRIEGFTHADVIALARIMQNSAPHRELARVYFAAERTEQISPSGPYSASDSEFLVRVASDVARPNGWFV